MVSNADSSRDSASSLNIKEFNVNSIGRNPKRQEIFNFLRKKTSDIHILIDTRFSKEIENQIKVEWGSQVFFSSFTSQSRGVAIFFSKNLCVEVLNTKSDDSGNILSLLLNFDNKKILLTGIYGPNQDDPNFYKNKAFALIEQWEPDFSIYGGDWNLVMN